MQIETTLSDQVARYLDLASTQAKLTAANMANPHFSRGSRQEVKSKRRKSGKRPLFSWHNCVVQT